MNVNTESFEVETLSQAPKISTDIGNVDKSLPQIDELMASSNAYDPFIPRKLMEGLCGVSTNILVKYEQEGLIQPIKARRGGVEVVVYKATDVQKVLKKRGISYKKRDEAEVIAIFSQKGGVGKSAFTQHLGAMLSLVGKTLVIDLDSQGDITNLLDAGKKHSELVTENDELDPNIAELMDWTTADGSDLGYRQLEFQDVVKHLSPTLDVIPADLDLGEINYSLNRSSLSERYDAEGNPKQPPEIYMVKDVIDKVKHQYDYILFDCPPNIETLNVAALFACNRILVPLELEAKSILTIRRNEYFLERLAELDARFHWDKVLIVPNKYKRENIKIKAYVTLQELFADRSDFQLSEVAVPLSVVVDRCSEAREPVYVTATRFGKENRSIIPAAKEFTNYFWAIMHEILDVPLDHLVFPMDQAEA